MDEEFRSLVDRLESEAAGSPRYARLVAAEDPEELARVLVEPHQPLWAREMAAFRLGCAGDRRAFEALVLLLNHRDPERCVSAAHALARLNDPRTPRAAAALATNALRTAYALHPVRLLTDLRAPDVGARPHRHPATPAGPGRTALARRPGLRRGPRPARRRTGPPGPHGGPPASTARGGSGGGAQPAAGGVSGRTSGGVSRRT
ncbi:hypothetical protein GA0115280_103223 [Streptomyces sp. Cmuel-A718b]|nr:hypothetical protein GA0115280_103223 [Streptomyces sp. Cmuel-A718b]